jgi:hypothetical protein
MKHVVCSRPSDRSREIILVDTPGFDDTHMENPMVLGLIIDWMKRW